MSSVSQPEALCRAALNLLLLGNEPLLMSLRGQAAIAEWAVTLTGCGVRAAYRLPDGTPPLVGELSFEVTDVYGQFPATEHIVNFALFVRSGKLLMLEGSTTDASWPEDLSRVFLSYNTASGIRDLVVFMASLRSSMRCRAT